MHQIHNQDYLYLEKVRLHDNNDYIPYFNSNNYFTSSINYTTYKINVNDNIWHNIVFRKKLNSFEKSEKLCELLNNVFTLFILSPLLHCCYQ